MVALTPAQAEAARKDIAQWRLFVRNIEHLPVDGILHKQIAYRYPEYFAYLNRNIPDWRFMDPMEYLGDCSPVYLAYKKEERDLYKQTLQYKMYKAGQAWRILFKLIIRTYFKRNK